MGFHFLHLLLASFQETNGGQVTMDEEVLLCTLRN